VSEKAAALALAKLADDPSDTDAADKVSRWLLGNEHIKGRADPVDVAGRVHLAAESLASSESPDAVLAALREELANEPGTTLVALFRAPRCAELWEVGPVKLGPPSRVLDGLGVQVNAELRSAADRAAFALRVDDTAFGVRGRRRALEWLRAALGGLYLAGRIYGDGADSRIGPVPADELAPSLFVGTLASLGCLVEAMRIPPSVVLRVDDLLRDSRALDLVKDCVDPVSQDLVSQRLRSAAPWIQAAFDALIFPDAVMALGVALEALIGSESKADVVRVVTIRTGYLLREGETSAERALSGRDWRSRATRLYEIRSSVAHGRYEAGKLSESAEASIRQEFGDLVCRIADRFRQVGRERGWLEDKEMRTWQEELEMA
jgi:hypothetical protein